MSNEQNNTAIVAIVIALIAFFVTTAQLPQALFGTAEGYRRWQPSVIGRWAEKTRRKWRWSESRFETIFTTPDIHLASVSPYRPMRHEAFIEGNKTSRRITYLNGSSFTRNGYLWYDEYSETTEELASWLLLLDMFHLLQGSFFRNIGYTNVQQFTLKNRSALTSSITCQAITFRTRSWDFMPPDIVRPFATSNIGDILALAHRLGMRWREVRPDDGVMRAEGRGQSITSTNVRGFGLLLQYTLSRNLEEQMQLTRNMLDTLTIPSKEADMLGFGLVPGIRCFNLPDFVFDKSLGIPISTLPMKTLGVSRDVQEMYCDYIHRSGCLYGFSDLISIVTPFLPLPGSSIVRVFNFSTTFETSGQRPRLTFRPWKRNIMISDHGKGSGTSI